jgi:hypothetical protein
LGLFFSARKVKHLKCFTRGLEAPMSIFWSALHEQKTHRRVLNM